VNLVVPLRGRALAMVVDGPGDPHGPLASLQAVAVEGLDLDVIGRVEASADARNRAATVERNDYLVLVRAGTEVPAGFVEDAISWLRADASTGLVGWSPGGQVAGSFELFVPGAALVVRHRAFHAIGGFDQAVDGEVEALDLGWRMWLAGYRVRAVGPGPAGIARLHESEDRLRRGVAVVLASVLDDTSLVPADWAEALYADARSAAAGRRRRLQADRRRGDGELLPLAHASVDRWVALEPTAGPVAEVLQAVGAPDRAGSRRRIAVVTSDTLAPRMAGPGIRALQIARRLAAEHDVVLATTGRCELEAAGVEVRAVAEKGLRDLERWCDVFLFQGWVLAGRDFLVGSDKVIVADVYDPMHLEQLEQGHDAEGERGRFDAVRNAGVVLNEQLGRADYMLCASSKQRDLWLGQLAALGRINPVTYDGDESLRSLLAVVPFGVGDEPPVASRSAIRGEVPGIGPDDKVVLWGGGVYNWFDPLTLVRAVDRLRHRVPELRLFFLGLRHPNPDIPEMRMAAETQRLAADLGLVGTHVFFNEDWVAFDDRQNFLLDADVAVSTHLDHIETEFSFRTRILDYLWAGLPILATDGDSFAEVIRREGLGVVVPAGDVEAVEAGLARLLTDEAFASACRESIQRVTPALTWSACLEPLVEICRAPRRAADVACADLDPHSDAPPVRRGRRRDLEVAWAYLRAGGPRLVLDRAMTRIRRNRT
jgi:glycosyltransferase involved in cell wall biosynthesis